METKRKRFDLGGKTALVTGGSKGIGRFMALELAYAGADIAVASRHPEEGLETVEEIRSMGRRSEALYADIARLDTLDDMMLRLSDTLGRLDILVNNAGTNVRKPAVEFTEAEWDLVLNTNLKGTFFLCQKAAKAMMKTGGGRIVNISSGAGNMAVPWLTPYSISKAGINHMTRALAMEFAPHGILVNAIAPSYIETPLTKQWLSDPKRYKRISERSPLKRLGKPSDLIGALLLLASEESEFITGQVITVDGGSSAGWVVDWTKEE